MQEFNSKVVINCMGKCESNCRMFKFTMVTLEFIESVHKKLYLFSYRHVKYIWLQNWGF